MKDAYLRYLARISPQYVAEVWPPVIQRGSGMYVFDDEGRDYVDLDAGWGAMGLGHCHPELVETTQAAVSTLEHTTPPTTFMLTLMERLGTLLEPYDLTKFFFGTSGSESVEHALMLALSHRPGRHKVLAFDRAYHGSTLGILPLSFGSHGLGALSRLEPVLVPTPHCYRCPFELSPATCHRECQGAFTSAMKRHADSLCTVLLEPALGREAIPLPKGYLSIVRENCSRHGIPLILDEIKTGIGRCGADFAFEHEEATPDIICLGKSLSNGFPVSVTVFKDCVCPADFHTRYLLLQTTFSGHCVACARACKVLEIMQREHIAQHSAQMGENLRDALRSLLKDSPTVAQVRGIGMLSAVEFVTDRTSKKPSSAAASRFMAVAHACGVHLETIYRNVVVLTPPLVMTEKDIVEVVHRLEKGINH